MNYLLNIFFLLFWLFCNNEKCEPQGLKNIIPIQNFYTIKYENLLATKKITYLSQIATNVEYIKLETNEHCLLGNYTEYFFLDDMILVYTGSHILKFSLKGKFLGKILSVGRGPGEIDDGANVSLIPESRLISVQNFSRKELLYFDLNGKLVKKVIYEPNIGSIIVLHDLQYLIYNFETDFTTKYTFRLSNEKNDTLSVVKNQIRNAKSKMVFNFSHPNFSRLQYSGRKVYFKSLYNDTVYSISSSRIIPVYFIDLGKYKLPNHLIPERIAGTDKFQDYKKVANNYFYANVLNTSSKIFLATYSFGKSSPKYFLIDKSSQEGFLLIDNIGNSTGIVNDWDGGIDFWPSGNITENKLYMTIDIMGIKNAIKNKNSRLAKFPEKQIELNKAISSSEVLDNPIIMIVTINDTN